MMSPVVSSENEHGCEVATSDAAQSADWQLAQLQTVARQNNLDWRHEKTSHCVFVRADGKTLPVPAHRPIKPVYVKKFVELIDGA